MSLKNALQWRYATKKFDTNYQLSDAELNYIQLCIQLAASSYGLQPYKVLRITDSNLRETLRTVSNDQSQITEASELFVFCNYTVISDEHIEKLTEERGKAHGYEADRIAKYAESMKKQMSKKSADEQAIWTAKQVYIALGNGLMACAELGLDACPMEGFNKTKYNQILNLASKGLEACVLLTIGKRSEEDTTADKPKYRKSLNDLFETIG